MPQRESFFGRLLILILLGFLTGCGGTSLDSSEPDHTTAIKCDRSLHRSTPVGQAAIGALPEMSGALIATRFNSLEDLRSVVEMEYFSEVSPGDSLADENAKVHLRHCSNGYEVGSILSTGIDQGEIGKARSGNLLDKLKVAFTSPKVIYNRDKLMVILILARRSSHLYGHGDPAFFDLAETMVEHITTHDLAYVNPGDSSEKGYINSFNHITAQAFITSLFSEELADFSADVHERYHMPELISGKFSDEQLSDPNNNPVDNYVDIINNEWGHEIGKRLKKKYRITADTYWTPVLLTNYLNDIQRYFSWAFQIGFEPFRPEDRIMIRFAEKVNVLLEEN